MTKQLYIYWFGRYMPMNFDLTSLEHGRFHFIKLMAHRTAERRNILIYDREEFEEAKINFYDFLTISGIDFGDKDYDWTPNGAFEIADEYVTYDDME